MNISAECVGCILKSSMQMVVRRHHDPTIQRTHIAALLRLAAEQNWDDTPPEFAERLYEYLMCKCDDPDPFRKEKSQSTAAALKLLPVLRELIAHENEPFTAILKAVIGGNSIDYGVSHDLDLAATCRELEQVFTYPLDEKNVAQLHQAMDQAKTIFYMLDNCGEAVFDRLLIERYPTKITIGVRGGAILNDITRNELAESGLDKYPTFDTGTKTPGVSLKKSKPEFMNALQNADLIIAKGQGNFETMSELKRPIAFLLRIKCPVVARATTTPTGTLQIILKNI